MSHEINSKIFPRRATGFRHTPPRAPGAPQLQGQSHFRGEGRPVLSPQARLVLLTNAMDSQPYNHRHRPWNPTDTGFPIQPVYGRPRGGTDIKPWNPDFPIQPVYGGPRGGQDWQPWKPDFPIQPVYGGPRGGQDWQPWKPDFPIQPVYGGPRGGQDVKPWQPDFPIQPVYGAPRSGSQIFRA